MEPGRNVYTGAALIRGHHHPFLIFGSHGRNEELAVVKEDHTHVTSLREKCFNLSF